MATTRCRTTGHRAAQPATVNVAALRGRDGYAPAAPVRVFGVTTPAGLEGMFAEQAEYFMCGPEGLMAEARAALLEVTSYDIDLDLTAEDDYGSTVVVRCNGRDAALGEHEAAVLQVGPGNLQQGDQRHAGELAARQHAVRVLAGGHGHVAPFHA